MDFVRSKVDHLPTPAARRGAGVAYAAEVIIHRHPLDHLSFIFEFS